MRGPASTDCRSVTEGKRRPSSTSYNWAGQKAMRSLRSSSLRSRDALHLSSCERSELPSLFNARIFYIFIYIFIYIYIYIFQAVRRAVNEMFETPDTVFNNLELLVNPSSTAEKCSATEDCCRNPGGDRRPSSTVKYCSATGLLPNRQRGERPGVNRLPFSHRRKETPVFNKLQLGRPKSHAETPEEIDTRLQQLSTAQRQDCCRIDRGERGPASTDCRSVTEGKRRPSSTSYNCSLTDDCDRIDGRETNPSSTAKKCSATEDCCRNPGGDRGPSSTVKYCSATGLLSNTIAAEATEGREARLKHLNTAKHFQVYMSVRSVSTSSTESERLRCTRDKHSPKLYSSASNMNPGVVPPQLMVRFYTSATLCDTMVFLCI